MVNLGLRASLGHTFYSSLGGFTWNGEAIRSLEDGWLRKPLLVR